MNVEYIIPGFIACAVAFYAWKKLSAPQSGCLYPHCSADKSHCLTGCKGRDFHTDYNEED